MPARDLAAGLALRSFAAADGRRLRAATWEQAPGRERRGVVALFHGNTEFIEKYGEVVGELAQRGFAGATFDWRGQGASERRVADTRKAHVGDFTEFDLDMDAFLKEIVANLTPGPRIALAHSMGGHLLLRRLHDRAGDFACAVATAPMIAVNDGDYPAWLTRVVVRAYNLLGPSQTFVWGAAERDPLAMAFEANRVTSDRARFARMQTMLREHPEIRLAGPTFGWARAAYRSMDAMRGAGYAEAIATPTLIFGAGKDRIVRIESVRDFAKRLPHGCYIEIEDAEHEIMMENDSIRARFWTAFDGFVGRYV